MKPVKSQADAKAEAEAQVQAAKLRQLGITLDSANWTEITIRSLGSLVIIRATDPQGIARSGARNDGEALVSDLLGLGAAPPPRTRKEAEPEPQSDIVAEPTPEPVSADERIEAPSPPTEGDRVDPLGFPDEAPDLAAENEALRARAEAAEKRLAELEARDAPVGLPPNPSETKLSDYGPVGDETDWLGVPAWLAAEERDGESMGDRISRLTEAFRARVNELNNLLLAGTSTEEEDRERTLLLAKYNELAELGDRS